MDERLESAIGLFMQVFPSLLVSFPEKRFKDQNSSLGSFVKKVYLVLAWVERNLEDGEGL